MLTLIDGNFFFTLTWQKFKLHHLIKAPSTRLRDIFFNPQLFLSGFGFRPLKHPVNLVYESASFLIRCAEWKFLDTLWIRNLVDAKSGYVFYPVKQQDRARFFTVNTVFKMATSTYALLPILLEESWVLRVNPDTRRIHAGEQIRFEYGYVWTWIKKNRIRVDGA